MKNEDYQRIIERINIPEKKLDDIKIQIITNKNPKHYKLLVFPAIAVMLVLTMLYYNPMNKNADRSKDESYFLTSLYANEKNYDLNDDKLSIVISDEMFGTNWQTSTRAIHIDDNNTVYSYLPFDVVIKGDNIKNITFSIIEGGSLDFYRVSLLELITSDLSKIQADKDIHLRYKQYNELRDSDKVKLQEIFQISLNDLEARYHSRIQDEYSKLINLSNSSLEEIKEYGWLFWLEVNQEDKIIIAYDQQDKLNYYNLIKIKLLYNEKTSNLQLQQDIKKELVSYKIKMAIEYNNGIIKEKMITFKEVIYDIEHSNIYMEIN